MSDLLQQINKIAGRKVNQNNLKSVLSGLDAYGYRSGLMKPHRLAQYLAQIMHESARFRYDREIWGPTKAQKRYEGRKDLGNVQPGDGYKFRGRGPIQITGRHNTAAFRDWCRQHFGSHEVPDFEETPDLINTDPWEGLGPIWYWESRKLNRYADQGDIEMVTKRINGGLNGYEDRLDLYTRSALVLLGYEPEDVSLFQQEHDLDADGISGPRTRAALHKALMNGFEGKDAQEAPVTVAKPTPKPVIDAIEKADEKAHKSPTNLLTVLGGSLGGLGTFYADLDPIVQGIIAVGILGCVAYVIYDTGSRSRIARRAKELLHA